MGAIPMGNDGPHGEGLVEQRNSHWDEQEGIRNVVVDGVKDLGLLEEVDSKINVVAEQSNSGSEGANNPCVVPEKAQPQGSLIQWENFLPKRSLKVMLVENDDSTRHVVSALLRNCSYEVTAVANGLQAWKILEGTTNPIDLILTEVAMPILSGIGLLCKIMSHKTSKNIPVIMMSPHDSMGLVFRCLSKGAVDFLVKPIRKNELKNLWQHVWRRCHSSSGSGSESGTQTMIFANSKSNDESGNTTCSSDEHENESTGPTNRDGSENGSGTQSSWTKRAAEVDSSQQISHWDQLAERPDSTCAQVIDTKPETFSCQWIHANETKEFKEHDKKLDNVAMSKDLEMCTYKFPDPRVDIQNKHSSNRTTKRPNKLTEVENAQLDYRSESTHGELMDPSVKFINSPGCDNPEMESQAIESPADLSKSSQIKTKASPGSRELPSLELTLKGQRGACNARTNVHDDRNILRHSDLSAFSKYNAASSASKIPTGNVGSRSPLDNNSVTMKTETMHNSEESPLNQQSNGSNDNDDMSSLIKYVTGPEALNDKSQSISAFKSFHSPTFQPVQNGSIAPQQLLTGKPDDVTCRKDEAHARGLDQQFVRLHHHHYHHHYHHVHNMQHDSQFDHDDVSLKNMTADASQCGSSNMLGGHVEGDTRLHSVKQSASASNHGKNGRTRSSNDLNARAPNMESDNGATGNSGVNGFNGVVSGSGADEDQLANREAALTKFRKKRKERCFEKKVRYHSRKKLAEQRPRVRGQFVRHTTYDKTRSDAKADKEKQGNIAPQDNSCCGIQ